MSAKQQKIALTPDQEVEIDLAHSGGRLSSLWLSTAAATGRLGELVTRVLWTDRFATEAESQTIISLNGSYIEISDDQMILFGEEEISTDTDSAHNRAKRVAIGAAIASVVGSATVIGVKLYQHHK